MTSKLFVLAACAAVVVPSAANATASTKAKPRATAPAAAPAKSRPAPSPAEMMAMMSKMMDLLFPAGPEPDAARLVVARQAAITMFPNGTYASAMNGFIDRTVDRVLSMSEADFEAMIPPTAPRKNAMAKPPSTEPLRVSLAKGDANFDAKVAAGKAFVQTTLVKFGDVAEPRFREGMARALARKFDARQLAEIQAFLATPTGAAYGREMIGMWFEPDVMHGMVAALPDMMRMMPDIAKSGAALGAQMKDSAPPK
ncbi:MULTISPECIES: hypothetical protein [Sphingomonas]|uniref:hypothetical protein n=1 Tax=Sphingomonas TaxID=13687 RepID=UPI000DEF4DDF|nr:MULTISPECIES: hypothetical protein [Sphingomonas]